MITSVIQRKRPRWPVLLLIGGGVVAAGLFAAAVLAVVPVVDTKDCEIEVANKNSAIETCTTNAGAIVSYIPDSGSGASSGTGVFVPFARRRAWTGVSSSGDFVRPIWAEVGSS